MPQMFKKEDGNENVSDSNSDSEDESGGNKASGRACSGVMVEDVDEDDDDSSVREENETEKLPRPPKILGRGMHIRKQPVNYEPSMMGEKYELGVLNLCFVATGTS